MMEINVAMIWPQIITGIIVSICSVIVTQIVQRTSKKLEDVATKTFVNETLKDHELRMKTEIGEMFVRSGQQNLVNADIEARLRRVEFAYGVKLGATGLNMERESVGTSREGSSKG